MRLFFVLVVVAVGFGLALTAPAAAQEAGNAPTDGPVTNATATATPTETPTPTSSSTPAPTSAIETDTPTPTPGAESSVEGDEIVVRNYERTVDRDVTLESWSYNTSTEEFTFDIYVQNRTRLYITEAMSVEEPGSKDISIFNERMSPGRTQITFSASPGASGEVMAVLQTPRSQAQGDAVLVSTGYVPDQLPFAKTSGTIGWIGGVITAFLFVVLAGVQTIRNLHSEPQDVK